ncbi:uncharacterized protein LAJ45_11622 [Morchella importuna]|uniref:uncharacterized protein n=1 Tax=Morchella importuna TaxID=1174673 RepID=UPI001E8EEF76|nr:uncharacterized protein LAJ45_11622 [Morchella importuna]KAH8144398.1 hypothetical protein LAJ45_11622 [Morchella importuna]
MQFTLPLLLALADTAFAHNFVAHFHINGIPDPVSADPILDINSSDMACNADRPQHRPPPPPADYPLKDDPIPAGVTDDSHKGPCSVYMKKVSDSSTAEGEDDGWFKVSEDGLDSAGTFCSDRIRLANAPQPGIIPTNIESADYLIRAKMTTLNNAGPTIMRGFYTGCVQITVEGSSGTNPDTVSIPGYISMSSPGMIYDIWNSPSGTFSDYTVPGPRAAGGPRSLPGWCCACYRWWLKRPYPLH